MTTTNTVFWHIETVTPPQPVRHCSTCGTNRKFASSGKIRLNANGRRLDAWLIYKCLSCEKTWNRPVVERAYANSIAEAEMLCMHTSDPAWVRVHEFDLVRLGRYCSAISISNDVQLTKIVDGEWQDDWSFLKLTICAQQATGMRLDRLLANELEESRTELQSMWQTGVLQICSASARPLKRSVDGLVSIRFVASLLSERQRVALSAGVRPKKVTIHIGAGESDGRSRK